MVHTVIPMGLPGMQTTIRVCCTTWFTNHRCFLIPLVGVKGGARKKYMGYGSKRVYCGTMIRRNLPWKHSQRPPHGQLSSWERPIDCDLVTRIKNYGTKSLKQIVVKDPLEVVGLCKTLRLSCNEKIYLTWIIVSFIGLNALQRTNNSVLRYYGSISHWAATVLIKFPGCKSFAV